MLFFFASFFFALATALRSFLSGALVDDVVESGDAGGSWKTFGTVLDEVAGDDDADVSREDSGTVSFSPRRERIFAAIASAAILPNCPINPAISTRTIHFRTDHVLIYSRKSFIIASRSNSVVIIPEVDQKGNPVGQRPFFLCCASPR